MLDGVEKTPSGWKALCPGHGDTNQSLTITEVDDGKTLLKCHGPCADSEEIVGAMGLTLRDLFADEPMDQRIRNNRPKPAPKKPPQKRKPLGEPVETYDYHDEDGSVIYRACRYEPKTFRQQRRTDGRWINSMGDQRLVLYRLPKVIEAVKRGETVYVVEGEKDVATAERLGLTATCNVAGSKKGVWKPEYSETLRGATVMILPDVDPDFVWNEKQQKNVPHRAGQQHGARVAAALDGIAHHVDVYELPSKDISDWVADTSGGREDLEHILSTDAVPGKSYTLAVDAWVASVKPKQPEIKLAKDIKPDVDVPAFTNTDQTDIGAADRLVERYGHELRYCSELKRWYVWDGAIWKEDKVGAATARAKAVARENTISQLARGEKEWKKGLTLENASKIRGALELASVDDAIAVTADVFDRFPDVLAVPNGMVDLRTGALLDADPSLMLTQMAPTVYDPDAKAPVFDAFLDSIMFGDMEMVEFLQRWLGYCTTGQTREQALVVAHGEGANGKGTLFDTVSLVLGPLAAEAPQGLLTSKRNDAHPAELMTVRGRRFMTASEVPKGSTWDEARLKWLTGEDTITARGMRQDFVSWQPTHKITVYLNNKPRVKDSSRAFWRRMLFVPFDGDFAPGRPGHDGMLRDKLKRELQGILAWLVRGSVSWYDGGIQRPAKVEAATEEYRADEDRFGAWLMYYRLDATQDEEQKSSYLYKSYSEWSEKNGERPMPSREFAASLVTAGFDKKRKRDGYYYVLRNEP